MKRFLSRLSDEMKVIKPENVEVKENPSKIFEGKVSTQTFVDESTSNDIRCTIVTFAPGSRTKLHTHTHEQVLYVTEGKGILATEDKENIVTPGTFVFVLPGEKHWHGATEDSSFSHIAIVTPGETNFEGKE